MGRIAHFNRKGLLPALLRVLSSNKPEWIILGSRSVVRAMPKEALSGIYFVGEQPRRQIASQVCALREPRAVVGAGRGGTGRSLP